VQPLDSLIRAEDRRVDGDKALAPRRCHGPRPASRVREESEGGLHLIAEGANESFLFGHAKAFDLMFWLVASEYLDSEWSYEIVTFWDPNLLFISWAMFSVSLD
jgi:hypothetical protein